MLHMHGKARLETLDESRMEVIDEVEDIEFKVLLMNGACGIKIESQRLQKSIEGRSRRRIKRNQAAADWRVSMQITRETHASSTHKKKTIT